MTTTEPHPSLSHRCPFCGAASGQPCTAQTTGAEKAWPHSRRIELTREPIETPFYQALCCECGQLRRYKQSRGDRGYWGSDPNWHRELCELKCDTCGHTTTHAKTGGRDYDEAMQRVALGADNPPGFHWDADRLRDQYRKGNLPRNPYLRHWRNIDEAEAAWNAGQRTIVALCGETITMNRDPRANRTPEEHGSDLVEPEEVRDMEYEDPETGLWWVEMDCVDCLRVANLNRLKWQRRELLTELLELTAAVDQMDAAAVTALREHIGRLLNA